MKGEGNQVAWVIEDHDGQVITNGHGEKVQRAIEKIPGDVIINNTSKETKVQPHFGSFNIALIIVLFAILDRGRIISPAYGRMSHRELERMRALDRRRLRRQRLDQRGVVEGVDLGIDGVADEVEPLRIEVDALLERATALTS